MMQAENKKSFLKKLALCFMLAFFISTGAAFAKFKVAFIYIGPPGDLGWTYMHDQGRIYMEEKLGDKVFKDKYSMNTDTTWNDGLLWRDGCMDDSVLSDLLDGWEELGFELIQVIDSQKYWKDVCVVNSNFGPSHPCNWIEYGLRVIRPSNR
mgnify:CR=1 FL=1